MKSFTYLLNVSIFQLIFLLRVLFFLSTQKGYNHICSANVSIGMFPSQDECCVLHAEILWKTDLGSVPVVFRQYEYGHWVTLRPNGIAPAEILKIWNSSLSDT